MQKINSASIILTEDCNMACSFCYERCKASVKMTKARVKESVDFIAKDRNYERMFLMWFGGEPLLMFDELKYGLEYAESIMPQNLIHLITTNGTVWNDNIERLFAEHPNINLQVSWMGLPELQDAQRGSSALVEQNIKRILTTFKNKFQVQIQVTPEVVFKLSETVDYIFNVTGDKGKVYIRPVPEADGWMEKDVLEEFTKQMTIVCNKHQTKIKKVCDVQSGMTSDKLYCNAGKTFCSITPSGDIYPCHRMYFLRKQDLKIGNIKTGFINTKISRQLEETNRGCIVGCEDCSAKDYCYICPSCNFENTGSFIIPIHQNCEVNKAYVKGIAAVVPIDRPQKSAIKIEKGGIDTDEALIQMMQILINNNDAMSELTRRVANHERQIKIMGGNIYDSIC